ncbi:MAG: type II toxin-antitoxin system prevent-host-death family antitoxin [Acidobacteriaceae bacterium]
MIDLREVRSVTDFQRNAKEYVGKLKGSKTPLVLTVNGRAALVVQDAASYQELLDRLEELELVAAVKEGLKDAAAGRVRPARAALAEVREKYGLPR